MNKRILAADQWRELIAQQQDSGLSIAAFCAQRGVAASTFFAWRQKLAVRQAPAFVELTPSAVPAAAARASELEASRAAVVWLPQAPVEPPRAPVELPQASSPLLAAPIELVLPDGLLLRVPEGFDAATLRQIVEALR